MLGRSTVVSKRFAARAYDWAAVAKKLPSPEARAALVELRSASDTARAATAASAKPVEPIDWAFYKKNITMAPGIVEELQKEYESMKLPTYVNEQAAEIDAKLKELTVNAQGTVDASKGMVTELQAEIAKLEANRTTRTTTILDLAERYPELDDAAMKEIDEQDYVKDLDK